MIFQISSRFHISMRVHTHTPLLPVAYSALFLQNQQVTPILIIKGIQSKSFSSTPFQPGACIVGPDSIEFLDRPSHARVTHGLLLATTVTHSPILFHIQHAALVANVCCACQELFPLLRHLASNLCWLTSLKFRKFRKCVFTSSARTSQKHIR